MNRLPRNQFADSERHSVILFDGVCVLCNSLVDFVMSRDHPGRFRFAPLQSVAGARVAESVGVPAQELGTMVLVERGVVYTQSTAALRVARRLSGAWPLLYLLIVIPRPLRNGIYRWVGANRYRWFGQVETCRVPTPEERERFL